MWRNIRAFLFENINTKQTVAKNTVWLSISNFGGRALKAIIIIYAARVLGAAGYGVFSYAASLAGLLTILVDPGVNNIVLRDVAKGSDEERRLVFSTTLAMKIALMAISAVVVINIAPIFSTLPGAKELLPLVAALIIFDGAREYIASYFRAREKMEWDATAFVLENAGIVFFGYVFMKISATPEAFTAGYVVGTILGALTAAWFIRKYFKDLLVKPSFKMMMQIISNAWPFAIVAGIAVLFTDTDILIISWMKNATDVGIYAAAIRIIQVLYIVPNVIQMATTPIYARLAGKDDSKFRTAFENTIVMAFLIALPACIGGAILGTQLMRFVFGASYAPGGNALSLLMIGLIFDYVTVAISTAMFAYNQQRNMIYSSALGGAINVALDLALIPSLGMTGSAIATLCAQVAMNWYLWNKMNKVNKFQILPKTAKIIAASVGMALVTAGLYLLSFNVLINIVISVLVYVSILLVLKEPLVQEVLELLGLRTPQPSAN